VLAGSLVCGHIGKTLVVVIDMANLTNTYLRERSRERAARIDQAGFAA
jgi:hypothetical protein